MGIVGSNSCMVDRDYSQYKGWCYVVEEAVAPLPPSPTSPNHRRGHPGIASEALVQWGASSHPLPSLQLPTTCLYQ
jgi:hypothetical protein